MSTEIYGASDDLIEFCGDFNGEVGCYGTDERKRGVLVVCGDGTILEMKYGKGGFGIWAISVLHKGPLFDCLTHCDNEDAERYSDTAHFTDGLKWAYAATAWEPVT